MAAKSNQSEGSGEGKDVLRVGLGEVLRECRTEIKPKLTQAELSARAQLPSNAIGDLERGERTIKGEELKNICKVLGIQVRAFMERVKEAQLRALGEPASSKDLDGTASARVPDLYLTMALAGNTPEEAIRMMHRIIKARRPESPEEKE
jgi:transcriptional regulator with XRE-family HTH domain